jgi:hypothetical protein
VCHLLDFVALEQRFSVIALEGLLLYNIADCRGCPMGFC